MRLRLLVGAFLAGVALFGAPAAYADETAGLTTAGANSVGSNSAPLVPEEKYEFQAEVSRLMDIIINSLYQKKDVFLRELISNSADALDKVRFLSLSDPTLLEDKKDLEIRVDYDKASRVLTIRDTGIGMTKQDLINNLGTVAKSGTAAFMEQLASGGDLSLIGQFGVGFYSAYLVADKVTVTSKHAKDKQYVWESTADGTFTVSEDPAGPTLGRGTEVKLHLKEDATEYTQQDTVEKLIKKYSEFITFPIYLKTVTKETVEVPLEALPPAEKKDGEDAEGEDEEVAAIEAEDAEPKTRKEEKEVVTYNVVNDQKAIWQRKTKDITDEEYASFYKSFTKDNNDPSAWIHFNAEGEVEFRSILFVPGEAPADLWDNYYGKKNSLRLYVRKVLIADEFEDLLPRYLNFIRGVVDSDDLPLNVSREQLQQGKILKVMGKKLVRKVLEMIRGLSVDQERALKKEKGGEEEEKKEEGKKDKDTPLKENAAEAYTKFWESYGKSIKLGMIEDGQNKSKLAKLLRWKTTATEKLAKEGKKEGESEAAHKAALWRSLDDYIKDMKPGQKNIYFIAGESMDAVQNSPFLERVTAAGLEVVLMTDPIDEYCAQHLPEYEGYKLQSITKEGLQLPGDEESTQKKREEHYKKDFKPLGEWLKKVLGDKVERVTISSRLVTSPAVLVTSQWGYSANMERIIKSQAFTEQGRATALISKKTMELNPRHPLVAELKKRAASDPEAAEQSNKDMAQLLFDTALLNSGWTVDDPKDFSGRMFRVMQSAMGLESLDLLPEAELPAEEPAAEDTEEEAADEAEDEASNDEL